MQRNPWRTLLLAGMVTLVLGSVCVAGASSDRSTGQHPSRAAIDRAVERVYPALVRIHVVTVQPSEGRLQKYESAGSGIIISKDGHVITNHHVAGKARRVVCRMRDGEEIEATLVGTDALADIAVVVLPSEDVLEIAEQALAKKDAKPKESASQKKEKK